MNDIEKNFCTDYTNKLLNCELCFAFLNPVDRNADWAPAYFQIIQRPMDLSTVKQKLLDDKYHSVDEWHSDINLIWKNATTFNKKPSLLYFVADFLQKKCNKQLTKIPHTKQELYYLQLQKANQKLEKLLAFDMPEQSSVPRVSPEELHIKSDL